MFYVYSADLTPKVYQSVFHLSITIGSPNNNQNTSVIIPGGIGVQPAYWNYHALDQYGINGRAPIYTLEDNSGIIRIQSNNFYNYTLGDFFQIWGRSLNSTCINVGQWYCSNPQTGMFLGFFVNGQQRSDYENHIILYQDIIKIDYQQIG